MEGNFFQKSTLVTRIFKYRWRKNVLSFFVSTLNTGLWKFGRLPFGVMAAPAIFQLEMNTMMSDLDFTVGYLDDIWMNSPNVEQHKEHVHKIF